MDTIRFLAIDLAKNVFQCTAWMLRASLFCDAASAAHS
ncbi:Uncharacterised protein [Burkholderia pseudomallei]|nr:transposase domain protein [Burkholderia pseudomallei]AIV47753.1 transposase domain protein [Burkholderia pseudomallei TSV 48]AJW92801.1 transposase domain protein [Burkholderia pseudomallei 406e]AJX82174.1 transposase domain protein [Burkholderia pseudomallei 7894]KGW10165.1 transposase domain protein [Burkholderia pseudomallei TSV 25]